MANLYVMCRACGWIHVAVTAPEARGECSRPYCHGLEFEVLGADDPRIPQAATIEGVRWPLECPPHRTCALSADDVGLLLGITRQAVDDRRLAGSLLATRRGGAWVYPHAQFHEKDTIPFLPVVLEGLKASGPWVTLEFLATPDDALDGLTPRDALLRGGEMHDRVLTLVRGYREGEGFA